MYCWSRGETGEVSHLADRFHATAVYCRFFNGRRHSRWDLVTCNCYPATPLYLQRDKKEVKLHMFDLVGIGNPVYDSIVTPFSKTNGRVLSGCSTNSCLAAKRLGLDRVGLIGRIGDDYADRLRSDLSKYGVIASLYTMNSGTGGFHLVYDQMGNRTLQVLGIAGKIEPGNIDDEFLDARFIIIGPILGEVDLGLVRFLRASSDAKLFLDPQGLIRLVGENGKIIHKCDRAGFSKILDLVDFVKPNEPESVTITGSNDPIKGLTVLQEMGSAVSDHNFSGPRLRVDQRNGRMLDSSLQD